MFTSPAPPCVHLLPARACLLIVAPMQVPFAAVADVVQDFIGEAARNGIQIRRRPPASTHPHRRRGAQYSLAGRCSVTTGSWVVCPSMRMNG